MKAGKNYIGCKPRFEAVIVIMMEDGPDTNETETASIEDQLQKPDPETDQENIQIETNAHPLRNIQPQPSTR